MLVSRTLPATIERSSHTPVMLTIVPRGMETCPARGALTLPEAGHSLACRCFTWRTVAVHNYVIPQSVKDRVVKRQGKLLSHDTIEASRTALVVVDMQNYFVA